MACVHLETYDNLRAVTLKHLDQVHLAAHSRNVQAGTKRIPREVAGAILWGKGGFPCGCHSGKPPRGWHEKGGEKIEDALQSRVIAQALPGVRVTVPLFRSIADRSVSLRLLNIARDATTIKGCDFLKSYSPCVENAPPHSWYTPLSVNPSATPPFMIYFGNYIPVYLG